MWRGGLWHHGVQGPNPLLPHLWDVFGAGGQGGVGFASFFPRGGPTVGTPRSPWLSPRDLYPCPAGWLLHSRAQTADTGRVRTLWGDGRVFWPWVGVLGRWAMHGSATALLCPQGIMTLWMQRTSQDLSWQRPELTVILRRALRGTESEHRPQPHRMLGDLGLEGWHCGVSPAGALALPGCSACSILTTLKSGQNRPILPMGKLRPGERHALPRGSAWMWEEEEVDGKSPSP